MNPGGRGGRNEEKLARTFPSRAFVLRTREGSSNLERKVLATLVTTNTRVLHDKLHASRSLCAGARTNSFVHSSLPDGGELSLELCSQRTRTVKRKEKGFTGGANELATLSAL